MIWLLLLPFYPRMKNIAVNKDFVLLAVGLSGEIRPVNE
jgi:hypothetical protein